MDLKFGKLAARYDRRNLMLRQYLAPVQIDVPVEFDFTDAVKDWNPYVFLNKSIGDCTVASSAHAIVARNAEVGHPFAPFDSDVLNAYIAITGYNPATGEHDDGAVEQDVLKYLQQMGIGGRKIDAYGDVDALDDATIDAGIYICEGLYIGIEVPYHIVSGDPPDVWDVTPWWNIAGKRIVGGHAIYILGKRANGNIVFVSWGKVYEMTRRFFHKHCDEVHWSISSLDLLAASGKAANGLDINGIRADVEARIS